MIPSPTFSPRGEESKQILKSIKSRGTYGACEEDAGYDSFLGNDDIDDVSDCINDERQHLTKKASSFKKPILEDNAPPDGGWGWVVVAASFFCLCVLDGVSYTFGMFLAPLMEDMECGRGGVSAAGSFQVMFQTKCCRIQRLYFKLLFRMPSN